MEKIIRTGIMAASTAALCVSLAFPNIG